jgi:hypothetical protein
MEIFTNEFKNLLSTQLQELTNGVKKDGAEVMSDYEVAKFMDACMNNPDCGKKEKKKKNKKFEVGDVVYLGERKGIVTEQHNDNTDTSTYVDFFAHNQFSELSYIAFTQDGRYFIGTQIILSHFPYKIKIKKIKK